ncbi:hypothetical protein GGH96_000311 [Coemansia sp. RSA 1972]|nr:hypothetical protein GGH96_000311 [Coemansia sp. RSA 1972]
MHFISTSIFSALAVIGSLAISSVSAQGCSSVNQDALNLIEQYEGLIATPEKDSTGQQKVGYGHTCTKSGCTDVPYAMPLAKDSAERLLKSDLEGVTECLNSYISDDVELDYNQWGALVSWAFSVGCTSVKESTLITRLNDGNDANIVAGDELPTYNESGGKEIAGLTRRRDAEVKLFQTLSTKTAFPECSED